MCTTQCLPFCPRTRFTAIGVEGGETSGFYVRFHKRSGVPNPFFRKRVSHLGLNTIFGVWCQEYASTRKVQCLLFANNENMILIKYRLPYVTYTKTRTLVPRFRIYCQKNHSPSQSLVTLENMIFSCVFAGSFSLRQKCR